MLAGTDGGRVGNGHGTAGEERIDRVARVPRRDGVFTRVVVDPALVAQRAILVEHEDCGVATTLNCFASVASRRRRDTDIKAPVRRPRLHVVERLADIGVAQLVEPKRLRTVGLIATTATPWFR